MTLDQAMERIKALWPEHDVTSRPLDAISMLKILEELNLIQFGEEEFGINRDQATRLFNKRETEHESRS